MPLTEEQQRAVTAPDSVAVVAGAGTGKTHMLVERYLWHIREHGLTPLQIVTTTFTRKAADEIRSRIRTALRHHYADNLPIMAEFEASHLTTMHALTEAICREHPEEAGIPPDFTLIDENETVFWLLQRMRESLEDMPLSVFRQLPLEILETVLKALLNDPYTAERALAVETDDWETLFAMKRAEAFEDLLETPEWRRIRSTLEGLHGGTARKLEDNRQSAIQAMDGLTIENIEACFSQINGMNFQGITRLDDDQKNLKQELMTLREWIKALPERSCILLTFSPVDVQLRERIKTVRQAYQHVSAHVEAYKRKHRELLFADLEQGALRALQNPAVQAYYQSRWQAFLIDEFQDTSPVQAEWLTLLTDGKILTIVGDGKQSIYGFRGADVTVFGAFQEKIRVKTGNDAVCLTRNFRTHQMLMNTVNIFFTQILGEHYQALTSHAQSPPGETPHIRVLNLQSPNGDKLNSRQARQAEGHQLAELIQEMLHKSTQVSDKRIGHRNLQFKDIAVLCRTNEPLESFCDALQASGIPAVVTGGKGSSLMETPEAQDSWNLLRFLQEPHDNLALACVLRSPFFAVSDRVLYETFHTLSDGESWWLNLRCLSNPLPAFQRIVQVLETVLSVRAVTPPTALLRLINRLTGYSAVISNLPNGARREADWQGFLDFAQSLENQGGNLFSVVREIRRRIESGITIPRPLMEAGDAVTLMTIHGAKGLEWPVVMIPRIGAASRESGEQILMDAELGLAFKLKGEEAERETPGLMHILKLEKSRREAAETCRILYVALTRARDYLVLTSVNDPGGKSDFEKLEPCFESLGLEPEVIQCTGAHFKRRYRTVLTQEHMEAPLLQVLGHGINRLPVTALTEYALCPKRFQFRFIERHPGCLEVRNGSGLSGLDVGTVTHYALEHGIRETERLQAHFPGMDSEILQEALTLALAFDTEPAFERFRDTQARSEVSVIYEPKIANNALTLDGVIDLLGDRFVLDYKTDRDMEPQIHRFQLWAYAEATGKEQAHIAYLRHGTVYTFEQDDLKQIGLEAERLISQLLAGHYIATPSSASCRACPYTPICNDTKMENRKFTGFGSSPDELQSSPGW